MYGQVDDPSLEQNETLVMADAAVIYMFCIECFLLILAEGSRWVKFIR